MQKKYIALGVSCFLAITATVYWWGRDRPIISGYPPAEELPDWLPSTFVPHPDAATMAWLYTAVDPETHYRQLFLYPTDPQSGFQPTRGVRLTASPSEKSAPAWGPLVDGVDGCTGQTAFFLADDVASDAAARQLHAICLRDLIPTAPLALDAERPVTVAEEGRVGDLVAFWVDSGNELHLLAAGSDGRVWTGRLEEQRLVLAGSDATPQFQEYRGYSLVPGWRYLFFSGLEPRSGSWQLGLRDVTTGREWPLTGWTDFDFERPTMVATADRLLVAFARTRAVETATQWYLAMTEIQLPRSEDDAPMGCPAVHFFPLPAAVAGMSRELLARVDNPPSGPVIELVAELEGEGATHQLYYAKAARAECPIGDRLPDTIRQGEWLHAAPITCLGDTRNPQWVGDERSVQLRFFDRADGADVAASIMLSRQEAEPFGFQRDPCPEKSAPSVARDGTKATPEAGQPTPPSTTPPSTPPPSTGPCQQAADCVKFEINKCEGKKYCDKSSGDPATYTCKLNTKFAVVCSIGNNTACVTNTCNPATGACAMIPAADGQSCNADQQACTKGDVCHGGKCVAGGWDYTDPNCQCATEADCKQHEDGDFCNGTLYCDLATHKCLLNPATVVASCPSVGDAECIKNLCQPATGKCQMTPVKEGGTCDDFNLCTKGETCQTGKCTGGTNTCQCTSTAECAAYEDGDFCNGQLYCDIAKGKCTLNPATIVECFTTNDTATMKNLCNPKIGKCEMTPTSP